MSFQRYAERPDSGWRAYLTLEDEQRITAIDAEALLIDRQRRMLTQERRIIQNRALQRALHHRRRSE